MRNPDSSIFAALVLLTLPAVAGNLPFGFDPNSQPNTNTLELESGDTLTIDTDAGVIDGDASFISTHTITDNLGNDYQAFYFDTVSIADGVTISITGSRGLALLSGGDLELASDLNHVGSDGTDGVSVEEVGGAGTDGRSIALVADGLLRLDATISVTGGVGGDGGPEQDPGYPGAGGDGGDAGDILIAAPRLVFNGAIDASGGQEGDVGWASEEPFTYAGQGGDGGIIKVCNDFTTTITADVSNGTEGSNTFEPTPGNDGLILYGSTPAELTPTVVYVDADRSEQTFQDGLSWATAFASLQDGLAAASAGDDVWVADGIY